MNRSWLFILQFSISLPMLSQAQVTKFTYDTKGNMTKTILTGGTNLCKLTSFSTEEELSENKNNEDVLIQQPKNFGNGTFKAFPNPTKGEFQIEFSLEEEKELFFEVFNSVGQKLLLQPIGKLQTRLQSFDLSQFPPGNYLIRLVDLRGNASTQKIVLQ